MGIGDTTTTGHFGRRVARTCLAELIKLRICYCLAGRLHCSHRTDSIPFQ